MKHQFASGSGGHDGKGEIFRGLIRVIGPAGIIKKPAAGRECTILHDDQSAQVDNSFSPGVVVGILIIRNTYGCSNLIALNGREVSCLRKGIFHLFSGSKRAGNNFIHQSAAVNRIAHRDIRMRIESDIGQLYFNNFRSSQVRTCFWFLNGQHGKVVGYRSIPGDLAVTAGSGSGSTAGSVTSAPSSAIIGTAGSGVGIVTTCIVETGSFPAVSGRPPSSVSTGATGCIASTCIDNGVTSVGSVRKRATGSCSAAAKKCKVTTTTGPSGPVHNGATGSGAAGSATTYLRVVDIQAVGSTTGGNQRTHTGGSVNSAATAGSDRNSKDSLRCDKIGAFGVTAAATAATTIYPAVASGPDDFNGDFRNTHGNSELAR